jgi:hypothetical protein
VFVEDAGDRVYGLGMGPYGQLNPFHRVMGVC